VGDLTFIGLAIGWVCGIALWFALSALVELEQQARAKHRRRMRRLEKRRGGLK
jgi:hypothetical protein